MTTQYLWVVELKIAQDGVLDWSPTIGVGLTKRDALAERRIWIERNTGIPAKCFRVRRYVAQ